MSLRPGMLHMAALLLLLLATGKPACAQAPGPMLPHAGLPPLKTVSAAEYRAHLEALRRLVLACGRDDSACDATKVGDDDRVADANAAAYIERFGWLRDLLENRGDPSHEKRNKLLPHADERLQQQLAELDGPQLPASTLSSRAQSARAAVLSRKEFRTTGGYSLRERLTAWSSELLSRLFGGASALGQAAPWLGTVLQWGTLLLAATLLVLWVYRALDRQRVTIGRLQHDERYAEQQAESRLWAARAREYAAQGEWREAIHALYWASIVALEDRRTLRRSGTRTPREALRLIDPASHLREPLRAQTDAFERIWYGSQPAAASDYETARAHYERLQAGTQPKAAGA